MKAISFSEARANLAAVIEQAVADRVPIAITRRRGEGAVLISESEWASVEETLYLLRSPANASPPTPGSCWKQPASWMPVEVKSTS